jgi:hypothetical protein
MIELGARAILVLIRILGSRMKKNNPFDAQGGMKYQMATPTAAAMTHILSRLCLVLIASALSFSMCCPARRKREDGKGPPNAH